MAKAPPDTSSAPAGPANRLVHETSPYLLQHAHNPVDWYPWGDEAFQAARQRDVPIFLSVGYSTCYWCHVMERESFEDPATGALMNDLFVNIKVDREERPDVDDAYMAAVQAMTQSGGWPMSVFLEPTTLKPFWCGTYFPPASSYGRPSFRQVLEGVSRAWREQRAEVLTQAEQLAAAVAERIGSRREPVAVGRDEVTRAAGDLLNMHDRVNGGFGSAPKFPQPVYLRFLLDFRTSTRDEDTLAAVDAALRHTLDRMALGGINDQVGGGFHRYSTDARWLVPHFEKMLYDNAQLAVVYAQAASVYKDPFYSRTSRRTLDYVLREMTDPAGGFYSAQDAEVNHREGQNYLWTRAELVEALGDEDAGFAARVYNVPRTGGNFQDPHHPDEPPSNVLALSARPAVLAAKMEMSEDEFLAHFNGVNDALYKARQKRPQPGRDDKVLTVWNGLMIGALAAAARLLNEPGDHRSSSQTTTSDRARYGRAAVRAASFIASALHQPTGELLRSYRNLEGRPSARIGGFLEDYAFFAHGLIELCRAGLDPDGHFLQQAGTLVDQADHLFGDGAGGFFDSRADQRDLFIRTRSEYDGAIPAAVSVMLNNLLDLFELTGEQRYLDRAGRCLASVSAFVKAAPVGGINSTRALLRMLVSSPAAVSQALPTAPPGEARAPTTPASEAVEVFASTDRVIVRENDPAGLILQVRIKDGYHIAAPDPGPEHAGIAGLRVDITNGAGVRAYADYPPGVPYKPPWSEPAETFLVYTGTISVPVVLEREGRWSGRPLLAVSYQACSDVACAAQFTVELDVAIDRE